MQPQTVLEAGSGWGLPLPRRRQWHRNPFSNFQAFFANPRGLNGVPPTSRGRVMIVDDDRSLLSLLRVIFEDANFQVTTFLRAAEALEEVKKDPPDAIILDLELPSMNGREFFRAVRQAKVDTPILLLSAHGARAARYELGAEAHVDKPFEPEQLVEEVAKLIERP